MQSGEVFSGEDDVALLTCEQGDCPLQDNSFIDSNQWSRATVNDKPSRSSCVDADETPELGAAPC
jgi:hypothetical protein